MTTTDKDLLLMTATLTAGITVRPTTPAGVPLFDTADADFQAHFHEHGFALLADALTAGEIETLNADAVRLCRGDLGEISNGRVSHEQAGSLSDEDVLRQYLCIHFPHKLVESFRQALAAPRVCAALTSVIGANVKAMQSMLFIKSEGKPGQPWHQDEFFIPTRDRSLTASWIALDDATIENGCLWVLPGSHRRGVIYPFREQDDPRFDCNGEAFDFPYADADAVPVEVPRGTAVIFNGYLLHRSLENSGAHGYRRALANHYMSAESLLGWRAPGPDEHMANTDYRDVVLVAGTDPYAYKGTTDLSVAASRPDRDGGCDR